MLLALSPCYSGAQYLPVPDEPFSLHPERPLCWRRGSPEELVWPQCTVNIPVIECGVEASARPSVTIVTPTFAESAVSMGNRLAGTCCPGFRCYAPTVNKTWYYTARRCQSCAIKPILIIDFSVDMAPNGRSFQYKYPSLLR